MTDQTVTTPPRPRPQPSKAGEILTAVVSAGLLAAWIGWQMGWIFALAGVVGVLVHESGHLIAINVMGFGPGRIQIIPFLGGAATPKRPADTEFKGVLISLAGPVFGLLAMAPFFIAQAVTGEDRWLGGAFFVAAINLLNLAPAPPLDGSKAFGPALAFIHPWLERVALVLVGAVVVLWSLQRGSLIFPAFVALSVFGSLRRRQLRPNARRLTLAEWGGSLGLYAAAVALCGMSVALTLDPRVIYALRRMLGL